MIMQPQDSIKVRLDRQHRDHDFNSMPCTMVQRLARAIPVMAWSSQLPPVARVPLLQALNRPPV